MVSKFPKYNHLNESYRAVLSCDFAFYFAVDEVALTFESVTIQTKATEQLFPVAQFILFFKEVPSFYAVGKNVAVRPFNSKLQIFTFWRCSALRRFYVLFKYVRPFIELVSGTSQFGFSLLCGSKLSLFIYSLSLNYCIVAFKKKNFAKHPSSLLLYVISC